jgi:tRNA (guanine37-N1)-methyltransferase
MRENIKLNKCERTIEAVEGDAREVVLRSYRNFADRILMTLPKSADKFLDVAFAGAKNGCIVHVYGFAAEEKAYSELEEKIAAAAKEAKRKFEIINRKVVRPYAPRIVQVVIDFKVTD